MHKILRRLESAKSVIICGHVRPDGDCLGATLGMYHYIRENYPEISVDLRLENVPEAYRLIPGSEVVISDSSDDKSYDLFIGLDASDKERLGSFVKYFDTAAFRICLDHHISNPGYADENLIRPDASSASEVLFDALDPDKISYNTAFALYTGIICDSGVFKYSCTGRHTMEVAGFLMEKGIPYTQIIDKVFYERSYTQARLLGHCLENSSLILHGNMIYYFLNNETMNKFQAVHSDIEGVVQQMQLTRGTQVSLLLSQEKEGSDELRVSMRSAGSVDVRKIAEHFGGGGHTLAAGATVHGDPQQVIEEIKAMAEEQLNDV